MPAVARQSNFEVLRIIAMTMILILHYFCDIHDTPVSYIYRYSITMALMPFVRSGVNIFFMISGWFLIKTTYKGLVRIIVYSAFFSLLAIVSLLLVGVSPQHCLNRLCDVLMAPLSSPCYWFIQVYFVLMLLAPLINAGIESLELKRFNIIVIVISVVFMWGSFFYGNSANYNGLNLSQGIWMYLLGRCLRLNYSKFEKINRKYFLFAFFFFCACNSFFLVYTHNDKLQWNICVFVVLAAVSLLLYFSKCEFSNRTVNRIASCSLSCYLFHTSFFYTDYGYSWIALKFREITTGWNQLQTMGYIVADCIFFVVVSWIAAVLFTPLANKLVGFVVRVTAPIGKKLNLDFK